MEPRFQEILRRFGHSSFKDGQAAIIDSILQGRDTLGVLPTGGGKSLCYILPALLSDRTALVVSPLIALMKDQVDRLRRQGVAARGLHSASTAAERAEARRELVERRLRLIFAAPERLSDPAIAALFGSQDLSLVAVDEAHCVSLWGHDFRPAYREVGKLRGLTKAPFVALTATATPRVRRDIIQQLSLHAPLCVSSNVVRPNLSFSVVPSLGERRKTETLRQLLGSGLLAGGSAIIYAATRGHVEQLASKLTDLGAEAYHAGLALSPRCRTQERFTDGSLKTIVATNAFGMGIDKSDVRLVVHYDIPGSLEAYYQEAGRAGRDGRSAHCVLLYDANDLKIQRHFIETGTPPGHPLHAARRQALATMAEYATGDFCRQKRILRHFGAPCGLLWRCMRCDSCRRKTQARGVPA